MTIVAMISSMAYGQRIGEWRSHISYTSVRHLADAGERMYAASAMGEFYYDKEDFSIHTLSKFDGISDIGISTIAYDKNTRTTLVAYNNGNIDILKDDNTHNISGIKLWDYSGNKKIYAVAFHSNRAFLACGFGIVVVNLTRYEIEQTIFLTTANGSYQTIYDIAITDSTIYAATPDGLMRVANDIARINIEENWSYDTLSIWHNTYPEKLCIFAGKTLATIMSVDPSNLCLGEVKEGRFDTLCIGDIRSVKSCGEHLVVSYWDSVCIYDTMMNRVRAISSFPYGDMLVHDAVESNDGRLWIAHDWAGMIIVQPDGSVSNTYPDCPSSDNVYRIKPLFDGIVVCPGGKSSTYSNLYISGNLYFYRNNEWSQLRNTNPDISIYDVLDADVDPYDATHISAASWGKGIVDVHKDSVTTLYNDTNTNGALIPYNSGTYATLRTGAVHYDGAGNLWVTNSLSDYGLAVRRKNGEWQSYNTSSIVRGGELDKLIWDSVTGYIWFAGKNNTIYVHDGQSQMAWVDPNNGSKLQTASINCMAQDQSGHIWLGTNKGIKVIYDNRKAFNNGGNGEMAPVNCSNILYSENDLVEYLLAYENITTITVDGANRKWVGTAAGGLYLLSASGLEQLEHFTVTNSPLFSNKIVDVAILPQTGQLFIGTDAGIQSYRATATYASTEPEKKVHIFPNPVRPEYDGPVAFRGFTRNALVHITDEAGHVVYSTRAEGGQAIWNIRTNSGTRVNSGVYFVFASDESGKNKSVGKILVMK